MSDNFVPTDRFAAYQRFWRRRCAQVFQQDDEESPRVDIYRFAPTWNVFAPSFGLHLYMTDGMSSRAMPVRSPDNPREIRHVELCGYTRKIREAAPGMDAAALALTALAHLPWRNQISIQPLETVTWGFPMVDGSAMTAFFLVISPDDQSGRLTRASGAQQVLNVMTISNRECELATAEGSLALLERFEAASVPPLIDWQRKSAV